MKSNTVFNLIKEINSDIADYIKQLAEFKEHGLQYVVAVRQQKYEKIREEFKAKITGKFQKLVDSVQVLRKKLVLEHEQKSRLYNPTSDSEILVYYQQKTDFVSELMQMFPQAILEMYESSIEFGSGFEKRIQMLEDSAYSVLMNLGDRTRANQFKSLRSRNIEERLPDELKSEEKNLKSFEPFERTANSFISEASQSNVIPDNVLYIFNGLSSNLKLNVDKFSTTEVRSINLVV